MMNRAIILIVRFSQNTQKDKKMNKFAVVFLTIIGTLLFSQGINYTVLQLEGELPTSLTGLLAAFTPFLCGALSIIMFWVVSSIKNVPQNDDYGKQEE